MRLLLKLGAGVVIRFVGMAAESFATWLFHEVSDSQDGGQSLPDLWSFCIWFVRRLASQLCGRGGRQLDEYGEVHEPAFFGAR